jgi:hypothetical protein
MVKLGRHGLACSSPKLERIMFGRRLFVLVVHTCLLLEDFGRLTLGRLFWRAGRDLVSFPIATFNRVEILVNRTIPSILAQTHRNIEVVVVAVR